MEEAKKRKRQNEEGKEGNPRKRNKTEDNWGTWTGSHYDAGAATEDKHRGPKYDAGDKTEDNKGTWTGQDWTWTDAGAHHTPPPQCSRSQCSWSPQSSSSSQSSWSQRQETVEEACKLFGYSLEDRWRKVENGHAAADYKDWMKMLDEQEDAIKKKKYNIMEAFATLRVCDI